MAPLLTLSYPLGRPSARDRRDACLSFWTKLDTPSRAVHAWVHDELRPTVCGSVHDDAATFSMSDRQALGFPRWPGPMEMSGAGVGSRSRGCCGIVWFCQVGARACLRSHQARLLPLNVHLTEDLSGTNPQCGPLCIIRVTVILNIEYDPRLPARSPISL